mmetsp:Transcript_49417/g.127376  ORF Transcript_49417/g.127376 Transcript_49417/m.127376 type:complete len:616 (-) Transcript_49417:2166-4013(-)
MAEVQHSNEGEDQTGVLQGVRDTLTFSSVRKEVDKYYLSNTTTPQFFASRVQKSAHKEAIYFEGRALSFEELDLYSNKVGQWAVRSGYRAGDVVTLLMENCIEFVVTWLGLAKAGVRVGLLNHHQRLKALDHAVTACNGQAIICGRNFALTAKSLLGMTNTLRTAVVFSENDADCNHSIVEGLPHLNYALNRLSAAPVLPNAPLRGAEVDDTLFFIFTSGTTGLPKAAKVGHARFHAAGCSFSRLFGVESEDRIFCPLPLYHSSAGLIGTGLSWYTGATFCLARKFSASKFFSACVDCRATVALYIGELLRYLLLQPSIEDEKRQSVRLFIGNGCRPDIWSPFEERFRCKIGEFYGSTEGNVTLFNFRKRPGAVGYFPFLVRKLVPFRIVKFDFETEMPIRDEYGRCVSCAVDEVGEGINEISSKSVLLRFHGYTDNKATSKKVLRDVFRKGDAYFRTGDLLKMDRDGFFYFVDRIGDTFRWKGENVSTTEVAEVLHGNEQIEEANVYGVVVQGYDGRAGMTALVLKHGKEFDPSSLYATATSELPSYAVPLFVRILPAIETTSTFKHKKVELVQDGFDPRSVHDPLFYRDDTKKTYAPMTAEIYSDILSGRLRV